MQVLVDAVCLRRTKADKRPDGSPLVTLPSKTIITRAVELSEEERFCYDIYRNHAQSIVARYQVSMEHGTSSLQSGQLELDFEFA